MGLVVLAGVVPAAVGAAEPDQQHEGSASPGGGAGGDPADTPDFDPGGDTTLPFETPDGPGDPLSIDTGTPPPDPDVDQPGALPVPEAAPEEDVVPADQPAQGLTSPRPAAPSPPATTAPSPPLGADELDEVGQRPRKARRPRAPSPRADHDRGSGRTAPASGVVAHVPATPAESAPQLPISQPTTAITTPAGASRPAARRLAVGRGSRVHVVRSGESLWSIAEDLLGRDASTAQVAREVSRLWKLNAGRIGTGDPNLVIAGTALLLR